jgi:hypothetical protein
MARRNRTPSSALTEAGGTGCSRVRESIEIEGTMVCSSPAFAQQGSTAGLFVLYDQQREQTVFPSPRKSVREMDAYAAARKFPVLAKKFPVVQNIFAVSSSRELRKRPLRHSRFCLQLSVSDAL